jgi:hypothetical protein
MILSDGSCSSLPDHHLADGLGYSPSKIIECWQEITLRGARSRAWVADQR